MPNYRRARQPGGTYFLTLTLANRKTELLTHRIDDLRDTLRSVKLRHPFAIDGLVVLPDHLHALLTLPPGDHDYARRVRLIKASFTRRLPPELKPYQRRSRRGERTLWQARYWEHQIRDQRDFNAHLDYIHINPVKHGHTVRVAEWPYSTFHRWVKAGVYPVDWAGGGLENTVGEPE